jgi:hypothetical protein
MGKVYKKVEAHIKERIDYDTYCDICGCELYDDGTQTEVNMEAKIGDSYPDCDCRVLHMVDICGGCFIEKIKPLIETTFNIKFQVMDNDERFSYDRLYRQQEKAKDNPCVNIGESRGKKNL